MRALLVATLAFLTCAPALACTTSTQGDAIVRFDFPDVAATMRDGWFLNVSVGGGPRHRVQVDTGSAGLAIAASAIPAGATRVRAGEIRYSSSGRVLTGSLYRVAITFTDVAQTQTVPMLVLGVDRITCDNVRHPTCTVRPNEARHVGVLGVGFGRHGSDADLSDIAGVREASVNPFLQLEQMTSGRMRRAYTIARDRITLGLAKPDESPSWLPFALTADANGDWSPLTGCFTTADFTAHCDHTPILVDTGVGTVIFSARDHRSEPVAAGSAASIVISGTPPLAFPFISAEDCTSEGLSCARWSRRRNSSYAVNTSRHLIDSADYRFDDECGTVSFRLR